MPNNATQSGYIYVHALLNCRFPKQTCEVML